MPIWSPGVLDNVEHPLVGPLRDGLPTVLAIVGSDANGRRAAVVQFERPDMYRRRGKQSKEELHLERFILDSKAQDGAALFDTFRSGSDPPDLVATRNGKELGVDLTQLVLQDRAAANAAFRAIRKEAVTRGVRRFRNLRRQLVYIVFGPETGGLPPLSADGVARVLDAMERLEPLQQPLTSTAPELPLGSAAVFEGGRLAAHPLTRPLKSSFFNVMGFEIAFAFTSVLYQDEAWQKLQRLVTQHDSTSVDALVVSVGAPVQDGTAYPSDIIAAAFVEEQALTMPLRADHITEVYLHGWDLRKIS